MSDVMIHYVDDAIRERIETLARHRRWTANDVILHALRHGLGIGPDQLGVREYRTDVATEAAAAWDTEETAAFTAAVEALAATDPSTLVDAG